MDNIKLKISTLTCNHCVNRVQKAIITLVGIEKAQVDLETGIAHIIFDPTKTSIKQIIKNVEKVGYTVEIQ